MHEIWHFDNFMRNRMHSWIYYASPLSLEAWIPQRFSCFNQLAHGSAKSHSPGPDTGIVSGLFFYLYDFKWEFDDFSYAVRISSDFNLLINKEKKLVLEKELFTSVNFNAL